MLGEGDFVLIRFAGERDCGDLEDDFETFGVLGFLFFGLTGFSFTLRRPSSLGLGFGINQMKIRSYLRYSPNLRLGELMLCFKRHCVIDEG